jgi:hypothetical protein
MSKYTHKEIVKRPDGTTVIVRSAYDPRAFTFPEAELKHIRGIPVGYGSEDVLDEHDGELHYYQQVRRFERDGKRWILLVHPREYAIEVELTRGALGELRPLPPDQAWQLARELDKDENRYPIEVESSEQGT